MNARPWLPDSALTDQRLAQVLDGQLRRWAADWLADPLSALPVWRVHQLPPTIACDAVAEAERDDVHAALSGPAKRRLLERCLAVDLAAVTFSDADRALLDQLAESALQALVDAVHAIGAYRGGATIDFAIGFDRGADVAAVTLRCPQAHLAGAVREQLPIRSAPAVSLTRLKDALGRQALSVEGVLGSVAMPLTGVGRLRPGEILVLDEPLDRPVELRIAGTQIRAAQGQLDVHGARPAIRLH